MQSKSREDDCEVARSHKVRRRFARSKRKEAHQSNGGKEGYLKTAQSIGDCAVFYIQNILF